MNEVHLFSSHFYFVFIFYFLVETGPCYVAEAGLELLGSSAGITDMSHHAWTLILIFKEEMTIVKYLPTKQSAALFLKLSPALCYAKTVILLKVLSNLIFVE